MIVDSMTHEEVYQELARDRDNIDRWFRHKLNENRRKILKCKNFPLSFWLDHTTPRKIRYLLYARVLNRHRQRMIITMVALRQMTDGIAAYLAWPVENETIEPMVYLPHVFKRYADPERGNIPKKGTELIKHFVERNNRGIDNHNQKIVGRSVRYNGQEHLSCCVTDGVLLGHMEGKIYVACTFITYEMCGGIQHQEFNKCRGEIPTDSEMVSMLREHVI